MGNSFKVINGDKLSKIGLWFFLTYLYSTYKNPNENRYKCRTNYNKWCKIIDNIIASDKKTADRWLDYATKNLQKSTNNKGKVSLKEQQCTCQEK